MSSNSASLYITQIRFCRALAVVRSLPTHSGGLFQPSISDKLKFYGLYKQALVGDCMLLKPSPKNIVQYAKWKSWDKLRGVSPIDAQIMYIQALIQLLKQFLKRYPDTELGQTLIDSVNYLEETEETSTHVLDDVESIVQWDTNDQEKEEFYLGEIEQDQILLETPLYSYVSSPITTDFPITPELSPKNQVRPSDRRSITSSSSSLRQYYFRKNSDDEFDQEVATTLSGNLKKPKKSRQNTIDIQTLQIEVKALCEEIDQIRKNRPMLRWLWLFKSVAKHAFFNFIMLMLVFMVLWRRRSPIAYAIIGQSGPKFKDLFRFLFNRFVYWKVTV